MEDVAVFTVFHVYHAVIKNNNTVNRKKKTSFVSPIISRAFLTFASLHVIIQDLGIFLIFALDTAYNLCVKQSLLY